MDAKSIKIALLDGTMDGIVTIEDDNSNELLLSAPRAAALELLEQPESSFFGVYLLLSSDCVYVGETTDYPKRIKRHLAEKTWWDRVVFLTTTDDKLNESHIKYIEYVLIEKAKNNKKLDTDNSKSGNKTNVRRNDRIMLQNYLDHVLFLLEFINVDVFSDRPISNVNYYKMVNKNVALIDKSTVAAFLRERGIEIGVFGRDCSYTGPNPEAKGIYYTIDPDGSLLQKDWKIVINDKSNYEIIIIDVPKAAIDEFGIDNFNLKRSAPGKLSIRMKRDNLIDTSGFDFSKYITSKISYAE